MPPRNQRHDRGGVHNPTTPGKGGYMEGRLEEIGRSIDIRVGLPATSAGIETTGFTVGFGDFVAGMAL